MDRREFLASAAMSCAASPSLLPVTAQSASSARVLPQPDRTLALEAAPTPFRFDPRHAAVLVVDMQNDFGSKGGMFDRAGIDITGIQRAVAPTAAVLAASRKAGIPVIYLQMAFHPDLSDMGPQDSPNWRAHHFLGVGTAMKAPNGVDTRILIRDSWGTDIVAALKPEAGDIQIYKSRFSGFYETDLHATLQRLGRRYLIVTGCTTSVCVESTIRDAMFRDYSAVLLTDCTAEPIGNDAPRSNHEASLHLIRSILGWTATSEAYLHVLEAFAQKA